MESSRQTSPLRRLKSNPAKTLLRSHKRHHKRHQQPCFLPVVRLTHTFAWHLRLAHRSSLELQTARRNMCRNIVVKCHGSATEGTNVGAWPALMCQKPNGRECCEPDEGDTFQFVKIIGRTGYIAQLQMHGAEPKTSKRN